MTTCCRSPRGRGSSTAVPVSARSSDPTMAATLPGPTGRATAAPRHAPSATAATAMPATKGRRQRNSSPAIATARAANASVHRSTIAAVSASPATIPRARPASADGSSRAAMAGGEPPQKVTRSRMSSSWPRSITSRSTISSRVANGCSRTAGHDLLHRHRTDAGERLQLLGRGGVDVHQRGSAPAADRATSARAAARTGGGGADDRHVDLRAIGQERRQVQAGGRGVEIGLARVATGRRERVGHAGTGRQEHHARSPDGALHVDHEVGRGHERR